MGRIRDEAGGNMTDAIIPALKQWIHLNSEVKRAWARVVLGWVTSWEVLVLHSLFHYFFAPPEKQNTRARYILTPLSYF